MTDNPIEKDWDNNQSSGKRLRAAREKLGLSIKDVANRLHLDAKHIESIEQDELDDQIAPVFMRGYLRSYARLLSLQPEPIVGSYRAADADTSSIFHGHSSASPVHSGDRPIRWIISIVILALIIVPVLWWQTRESLRFWELESEVNLGDQTIPEQPANSTNSDSAETPLVIDSNSSRNTATTRASATLPTRNGESPVDTINPSTSISTGPEPPVTTENPPSVSGDGRSQQGTTSLPDSATASHSPQVDAAPVLTLQLSADSWVEVTDAANTQLIYSLLAEGNARTLEGFKPPLRILLGNASGVTVQYNGQAFDHSSYQRNGLARFTLGEPIAPNAAE